MAPGCVLLEIRCHDTPRHFRRNGGAILGEGGAIPKLLARYDRRRVTATGTFALEGAGKSRKYVILTQKGNDGNDGHDISEFLEKTDFPKSPKYHAYHAHHSADSDMGDFNSTDPEDGDPF
jgi:hypothetical protein